MHGPCRYKTKHSAPRHSVNFREADLADPRRRIIADNALPSQTLPQRFSAGTGHRVDFFLLNMCSFAPVCLMQFSASASQCSMEKRVTPHWVCLCARLAFSSPQSSQAAVFWFLESGTDCNDPTATSSLIPVNAPAGGRHLGSESLLEHHEAVLFELGDVLGRQWTLRWCGVFVVLLR